MCRIGTLHHFFHLIVVRLMRVILVPFLLLLFSGCQTLTGISHDYPEHWPTRAESKTSCPNLTGLYIDKGIPKYDVHHHSHKYLSFHFLHELQDSDIRWEHGDSNETQLIQDAEKQLKLQLFQKDNLVNEVVLQSTKDYECQRGILWLDSGEDAQGHELGGYKSWFKIGLQLAQDGSIVGQVHQSNVALALWVIPMGGKQIIWYRWPEASQSNKSLNADASDAGAG